MSFESYAKWWITSKKQLEDISARDDAIKAKFKPINDRSLASELIGGQYCKYSLLVQNLESCVDQMAQPQMRMTAKKLLDAAAIRFTEFNDELRKIDLSEYHYIDGNLIEMKLIPYNVEIVHPYIFHPRPLEIEDMWSKIKDGEVIYVPPQLTVVQDDEIPEGEELKGKSVTVVTSGTAVKSQTNVKPEGEQPPEAEEQKAKRPKVKKLSLFEKELPEEELQQKRQKDLMTSTTILIQSAERARQCRVYFFEKNLVVQRRKALPPGTKPPPEIPAEVKNNASSVLQKTWRGFSDRQMLKRKEAERRLLISMTEPSWKSTKQFEIFEANLQKRRDYRDEKLREYIEAIETEKARLLRVMAPGLFEDIGDEIREWFYQWYIRARTFDVYPPEEKGGTILVVRGETFTPEEYLDDYEKKRREKVKNKGKDMQKEKEKAEKKKKEEAEKKKKEAEKKKKEAEAKKKKKKKGGEFEMEEYNTASKEVYNLGQEEYDKLWIERGIWDNPLEKYYMDLISEKHCYDIQLDVRKNVDELMRIELDLLNDALMRDKNKKPKKKKKGRKGKKKKGKKKKDPTGDRMTEDLFQELVNNGIIRTYPKGRLDDYKGDFSYNNCELRNLDFDPPATLLDVRQAVTMNCIIPLGVETMKRPRSVLIAGPRQSGKHLLANAVFNETKCVLFDLSPEVTAGKYPGKKGLVMLLHLINKMSRLLQPSIIYFEAAEKIFYKKVPKEERDLDPKRIGKKLVKGIIKTIKPEDRVLVLGLTGRPWMGQAGKMKKAFEKVILIPRPDYGSVYLHWREKLLAYHAIDRNFDFTSLTKTTRFYPFSVIDEVIKKVLNPRRLIQLKYKPLKPEEIYEVFVSEGIQPIADKEWKKYIKWYNRTPLGKEKNAFNKWADQKRMAEAAQAEKQKNRK